MFRTRRSSLVAGLIVVAVAVTAPVAQGGTRPDDRAVRGVAIAPDAFERAAVRAGVGTPDVFERAVLRAESAPALRPDDRAEARGPGSILTSSATSPAGESSFSWEYATVGVAGMLGICLAALAGFGLVRQHRRIAAH